MPKKSSFDFLKGHARCEPLLTCVPVLRKEPMTIMGVRSLVFVLLCLLVWFNVEVQGAQLDSRELTIADIPACGVGKQVD